jgi:anti-sigma regulatory factor (Ser/Thr protein kinase)
VSDFDGFAIVREGIVDYLKRLIPYDYFHFLIAVNEAINNAIVHGDSKDVMIDIDLEQDERIIFSITNDEGTGFNYLRAQEKSRDNITDETLESGRGLYFMEQFSDKVMFENEGNRVVLVKNFTEPVH